MSSDLAKGRAERSNEQNMNTSLRSKLAKMAGLKRDDGPQSSAVDVLVGLSPELVLDLAHLAGSTLDDLLVTFQVMPWGDRATLAAYKAIELAPSGPSRGRVSKVLPFSLELVEAAAEIAGGSSDVARMAAELRFLEQVDQDEADPSLDSFSQENLLDSAAIPFVEVTSSDEQRSATRRVYGIVESVAGTRQLSRLRVRVPVDARSTLGVDDPRTGPSREVIVVTKSSAGVREDASIVLAYYDSSPLSSPLTLSIEQDEPNPRLTASTRC